MFQYLFNPLLTKVFRRAVTVLLYHDVDKNKFAEHVQYLKSRYNIIPLKTYADCLALNDGHRLPDNSLIITADDGWASNFELLDILKRTDTPMTIFLCEGLVGTNRKIWNYTLDRRGAERQLNERLKDMPANEKNAFLLTHNGHYPEKEYSDRSFLSLGEVAEMANCVDFQAHGIYHEVLTMCDDRTLEDEISSPISALRSVTKNEIYAFAFPYGRRNRKCVEIAGSAGYSVVRTSNIPGLNFADEPEFELKSIGIGDHADLSELKNVLAWAKVCFLKQLIFSKLLPRNAS